MERKRSIILILTFLILIMGILLGILLFGYVLKPAEKNVTSKDIKYVSNINNFNQVNYSVINNKSESLDDNINRYFINSKASIIFPTNDTSDLMDISVLSRDIKIDGSAFADENYIFEAIHLDISNSINNMDSE